MLQLTGFVPCLFCYEAHVENICSRDTIRREIYMEYILVRAILVIGLLFVNGNIALFANLENANEIVAVGLRPITTLCFMRKINFFL